MSRTIKMIDEDTLEMKDVVIDDGEEVVTGTLSEEDVEKIERAYRQATRLFKRMDEYLPLNVRAHTSYGLRAYRLFQ